MSWFAGDAAEQVKRAVLDILAEDGHNTEEASWQGFARSVQYEAESIIESAIDDALNEAIPGEYETGREDAFVEVEGIIADQLHRIELLHLDTDLSAAEVLRKIQDALGQISA